MTAEFDWWLLIVGLVIGAGLAWLILADVPRRDAEIDHAELGVEAAWIAATLSADERPVDAGEVAAVLHLHRAYLKLPPPDDVLAPPAGPAAGQAAAPAPAAATAAAAAAPPASASPEPPAPDSAEDGPPGL